MVETNGSPKLKYKQNMVPCCKITRINIANKMQVAKRQNETNFFFYIQLLFLGILNQFGQGI